MNSPTRKARSVKKPAATTISSYLSSLPEPARTTLEKLRKVIRSAAPRAEEVISYRMPVFRHQGMLVAFAAFPNHCSFFVMSPKVMAAHKDELKAYATATATIRFPVDKPLPATLVKKLVKARIEENEARAKARTERARAKRLAKRGERG